jgi:GlcNAc-P-P-Und epimerase
MSSCIIFGGAGYIGTKLIERFVQTKRFSKIYIADIKPSPLNEKNVVAQVVDVRKRITITGLEEPVEWIFNLAAIHREPGHRAEEYYETNILGAQNVCAFAEEIGCKNIFFTASISVYGPTIKETSEDCLTTPNTPYGISKLTAEYIHQLWAAKKEERRLVSVRPGVIYGPDDPGNILRMIKAVKKGYFFLPVTPTLKKSYGYIYGLLDSMTFMMDRHDKVVIYNYVEKETETLGNMIKIVNRSLGFNGRLIRVPFFMLKTAASLLYRINPNLNGIHPERVKKVARPTHIIPLVLQKMGFTFRYDFEKSLSHWKSERPADF